MILCLVIPERLVLLDTFEAVVKDDGVIVAARNEDRSVSGKVQRIDFVFMIAKVFGYGKTPHRGFGQSHCPSLAKVDCHILQ